MLRDDSFWCLFSRARAASSVCILAGALWAAVACGSDDSSGSTSGAGGDQSSGGTDSAGGNGGSSGETSTDGGGGAGNFSSVWRAKSVELTLYDVANPNNVQPRTFDMPTEVAGPGDAGEVEVLIQFEGEHRITYTYTEGDSAYYRLLEPAVAIENMYFVQGDSISHTYSIDGGKLSGVSTLAFGSAFSGFMTTTYEKVAEFPPSDWPSKVVSYEIGGAQ